MTGIPALDAISVPTDPGADADEASVVAAMQRDPEATFRAVVGEEAASKYLSAMQRKTILEALRELHFFPVAKTQTVDVANFYAAGAAQSWSRSLQLEMRFVRTAYVKNASSSTVYVFGGMQPGTYGAGVWAGNVITAIPELHWEIVPIPDNTMAVTFAGTGQATTGLVVMAITDAIWTPSEGVAA